MKIYSNGKSLEITGGGGGQTKDIYSTEERVIGTWIDGKPLYSITYANVSLPSTSSSAANVLDISDRNIENLISLDGSIYVEGELRVPINIYNTVWYAAAFVAKIEGKKYIRAICSGDMTGKSAALTLKYTKTTDSATASVNIETNAVSSLDTPSLPTSAMPVTAGVGLGGEVTIQT